MSAPWLFEGIERNVTQHIKDNIELALQELRDRSPVGSNPYPYKVNPVLPQSYFNFVDAIDYKLPAIFVICKSIDLRQKDKQGNHITALAEVQVSCVVEEKRSDMCNALAYRYASALHSILEQANIEIQSVGFTPPQGVAKDFVRVSRMENSDLFTSTEDKTRSDAIFRKEIALFLEVEHFENY